MLMGVLVRFFLRNGEFYVNDIVNVIKILDTNILDEYVLYELERTLLLLGYSSWSSKLYKEKLRDICIEIPIDKTGNFDLKEQKQIADKHKKFYGVKDKITDLYEKIKNLKVDVGAEYETKEVFLSNEKYFYLFIGTRVLKKEVFNSSGKVPVYSANVFIPFGFLDKSNIMDFSHDYLLWGIDGNFEFNIIKKEIEFATTDHCGAIKILDDNIMPEYLLYELNVNKDLIGYNRTLRASLTNMKKVSVKIPVKEKGIFDYTKQKEIAERYLYVEKIKEKIADEMDIILKANIEIE